MKRLWLFAPLPLLVVGLVLTALWLSTSASAGDNFRFSSQGAEAVFFSADGAGVETSFHIFAENGTFQSPPGPGDRMSRLFVDVFRFDPNTGASIVFFGDAELPPGALTVNRKLMQATLQASGSICGFLFVEPVPTPEPTPTPLAPQEPTPTPPPPPTSTPAPPEFVCFDGAVDLVWEGSGPLSRSMNHFHFKSEDFIDNSRCTEAGRFAVASGSATAIVEGVPMEFAPNPSDFGFIFTRSCHDVFID